MSEFTDKLEELEKKVEALERTVHALKAASTVEKTGDRPVDYGVRRTTKK